MTNVQFLQNKFEIYESKTLIAFLVRSKWPQESSSVPLYFQLLYIIFIIYESSHGKVGLPNTMLPMGFNCTCYLLL